MTIDKQHGRYIASCDTCGTEITGNGDLSAAAFDEIVNDLRTEGWRFDKKLRSNAYEHYCPKCS